MVVATNGCSSSVVYVLEQLHNLPVGLVAERPQQRADRRLALAVHLHGNDVAVARLELHPRAAVRDELGGRQRPARVRIYVGGEVDAGRSDELADHDALRAVDDERAGARHHGNVAQEQRLLLDFALSRAGGLDLQADGDVKRGGVGDLLFPALLFGVLRLVEVVVVEGQLEPVSGLVFDGRDLLEQLAESVRLQPVERAQLYLQQVWNVEH